MPASRLLLVPVLLLAVAGAACSGDDADGPDAAETDAAEIDAPETDAAGLRVVTPAEGAAIQTDPPRDLVILDVRTPEEFAEGHLEGAVMVDFYEPDFADRIADLDRDTPYLLYCRSGNRSGQTRELMADLGFTDVADVDGGVQAWSAAGFPLVAG